MLPVVPRDELWSAIAALGYVQHGGSGFGYGLSEVLELDYGRMVFLLEKLDELRDADSAAIQKAQQAAAAGEGR